MGKGGTLKSGCGAVPDRLFWKIGNKMEGFSVIDTLRVANAAEIFTIAGKRHLLLHDFVL